jgi:inositol transport system ATP-binding protein
VDSKYILEMKNISKYFPGVKAVDNVSFEVKPASVHALVGENGAGKSTLMNILNGSCSGYEGEIIYLNKKIKVRNTREVLSMGISMIHQELEYISERTVAENIFLGREIVKFGFGLMDKNTMNIKTKELLKAFEIQIEPDWLMKDLSVAEKQIVEILKAVSYNSSLIIMDEPTSAISDKEIDKLFKLVNQLKEKNVSIIYISHKLNEIFELADEITVLRNGKKVGTYDAKRITENELLSHMLGERSNNYFTKGYGAVGSVKLFINKLTKNNCFKNITFSVKEGEILGVTGLMGAKKTEIANCIFGLDRFDSGEISINGKKVAIKAPSDALNNGIGLISEDRKVNGLVLSMSVGDNVILSNVNLCSWGPFINKGRKNELVKREIRNFDIKTTSNEQLVKNLSGGNQQKVVLAKALLNQVDIIILDEPTRGIDIGSKIEIYKIISELAGKGKSIIIFSSEIMEILKLSHRVIVLHEGALAGELTGSEITQENILKFAIGV